MCVHCTNPAELGLCRSANSDLTVLSHQTSTLVVARRVGRKSACHSLSCGIYSQTRVDVIAEIIYITYGDSCLSASVPGARVSGLTFGLHGVHIVRRGFGVHVLHNTTGIARLRAWRTEPTRRRWSVNKYTAYRIVLEISDVAYGEMNGHESCGLYIFGFHSAVRSIENVWRFYKLDYYLIT